MLHRGFPRGVFGAVQARGAPASPLGPQPGKSLLRPTRRCRLPVWGAATNRRRLAVDIAIAFELFYVLALSASESSVMPFCIVDSVREEYPNIRAR